jgi:hypothetical protein
VAAAVTSVPLVRGPLGRVTFSELKAFARSPAHYRHACVTPREPTRAMRIGTLVDRLVFGTKLPPIWHGDSRRGKEWQTFASLHAGEEICTQAELDDARPIAAAVLADPVAKARLVGRYQVPLEWELGGVRCTTRGLDVVGAGWIADLKVPHTSEPQRFAWHARSMLWHAQLSWYAEACRLHGIDTSKGLFLIAVESSPPHPVTVHRLTPRAIEDGARAWRLWLEQLQVCDASGVFPGYAQSELHLDTAGDVELVGLSDADED